MQKAISDKIQIGQTLNPANDYGAFNQLMTKELWKI